MKILVTGAKGFVGKNLCEALKNIRDGKDRTSTVRGFHESLDKIAGRCDNLDKKQKILEQMSGEVDKTFDKVQDVQGRLDKIQSQAENLPDTIANIQSRIDEVTENSGRINDAIEQMTSLKSLLSETEERIRQVQNAREGIVEAEVRLTNLSKEADEKIDLLHQMTKNDIKSIPTADSNTYFSQGPLLPKIKDNIITLRRQGWTPEEIARRLKRTLGEVEATLEMNGLK